jgi:hypothetical protein
MFKKAQHNVKSMIQMLFCLSKYDFRSQTEWIEKEALHKIDDNFKNYRDWGGWRMQRQLHVLRDTFLHVLISKRGDSDAWKVGKWAFFDAF